MYIPNITPVDVSDNALYTEHRWHAPFEKLRAEMPVSFLPDSPYGPYWSVVTHDLIQQVEVHPEIYSSSWKLGNITIQSSTDEASLANFSNWRIREARKDLCLDFQIIGIDI